MSSFWMVYKHALDLFLVCKHSYIAYLKYWVKQLHIPYLWMKLASHICHQHATGT